MALRSNLFRELRMKQAAKVWVSYGVRVTATVTQVYGRQSLDPMWPRSTLYRHPL